MPASACHVSRLIEICAESMVVCAVTRVPMRSSSDESFFTSRDVVASLITSVVSEARPLLSSGLLALPARETRSAVSTGSA